jgi:4-amino-4-deoxy-L-arabinose transferase-like glycosyltransferase
MKLHVSKKSKFAPYKILILISVLAAIIFRFAGLFQPVSFDEFSHLFSAINYNPGMPIFNGHPPFISLIFHIASTISLNTVIFRSITVFFGFMTLFIGYLMCKKRGVDIKWYVLFAVLSTYVLFASLIIDIDGPFLTFFFTLFLYLLDSSEKGDRYLFAAGIVLAISMFTKYTTVILPVIAFLYLLAKKESPKKTAKTFLIILPVAALIFLLFPVFLPVQFHSTLERTASVFTVPYNLPSHLIQVLLASIWITPLFIIPLLFSLLSGSHRGRNKLFLLWIVMVIVFYSFIIYSDVHPLERYYMLMIPPLLIVASAYVSSVIDFKKYAPRIFVAAVLFMLFFSFLSAVPHRPLLNFYPKTAFLSAITSPNTYIYIQGGTGPAGFYLSLLPVVFVFLASFALFLLSFADRKRLKTYVAVIIALALGFNLFLTSEYMFSATGPDIKAINDDVVNYALANQLKEPVYLFRNSGLLYYLIDKYHDIRMFGFNYEFNSTGISEIVSSNGSVILVDFPQVNKESVLWKGLNSKCTLLNSSSSKGRTLGYIFSC